jgi:hypothetical protein
MFDFDPPPPKADDEFFLPIAGYRKALYRVCCLASSAVDRLIGSLDYYREQIENEPQGLRKFMKAHDFWVKTRFCDAGGSDLNSLAALEHFVRMQKVLAEMFERFVPKLETFAQRTRDLVSVEWSITHHRQNAATLRNALAEFNTTYAAEIAADRASDAFKAEQVLIAKCVADLGLAAQGKWTPEYVYVESLGRDLERPGSAELSEIAKLARTGRLRLPPTLLSSDRA